MVKKIILFILFTVPLYGSPVTGLYDEFLKPGAESKGQARALTAFPAGLISCFYNPANLAFSPGQLDLYFSRENFSLLDGITHLCLALGGKVLDDPLLYTGLSWRRLDYFDAVSYEDNENIITASLALRKSFFLIGMNMKYFISQLGSPGIKADVAGLGFDSGLSLVYRDFLLSFSILNIWAELGFPDGYKQGLERRYNAGISFRGLEKTVLCFDAAGLGRDNTLGLSASYTLTENISFSLGVNSQEEIGAGLSFTIRGFSLKYGYLYSLGEAFSNASFSILFGF